MTRDECIQAAAREFARIRYLLATRTPRESAEAAWVPGGPSLDELEAKIRVVRGEVQQGRAA